MSIKGYAGFEYYCPQCDCLIDYSICLGSPATREEPEELPSVDGPKTCPNCGDEIEDDQVLDKFNKSQQDNFKEPQEP